ncbi:hypothetical protein ABZV77_31960 [Streptomyces sp. NPDC004732]|uniref:hypothetical protein n=1 Tax=Streptomyces sp. NPDC004732 TaxID=3154290 RepID=UPI0033BEC748
MPQTRPVSPTTSDSVSASPAASSATLSASAALSPTTPASPRAPSPAASASTASAAPAPAAPAPLGRPGRVLRFVSVAACVPYLALKVAWISGSRPGIPDGSPLLDHRALMIFANGLTVLMDAAVIVLALLLTCPWGLRTPAWLLAAPMWAATGLLLPIVAGFPLTQLAGVFDGGGSAGSGGPAEPFLHEWVFGVVYVGFIVQGLALGALFVRYARARWSHAWRGRVGDLPPGPGRGARTAAVTAAVLALLPVTLHLLWACGSTTGLAPSRARDLTQDARILEALSALYPALAVTGALLLAFRWGRALPVGVPLALGWLGSGAVACWGGWLLLGSLTAIGDAMNRPTGAMLLTYAVQMIIGAIVAVLGTRFLRQRAGSIA